MTVRNYRDHDYEALKSLYMQSSLYGGQFDPARDARDKLQNVIARDPEAILVYDNNGDITGTVSLIEDSRVAWLFRFAVKQVTNEKEILQSLHHEACRIFKKRGHQQVLVYTPVENERLAARYRDLGMNQGNNYTCFWQEITL